MPQTMKKTPHLKALPKSARRAAFPTVDTIGGLVRTRPYENRCVTPLPCAFMLTVFFQTQKPVHKDGCYRNVRSEQGFYKYGLGGFILAFARTFFERNS